MNERRMTSKECGFQPTSEPLAVFRREGGSKAVGCLVYILVTPFVALFLALFIAMPIAFGLQQLGVSEESTKSIFPIVLIPSCLGTIAWGIRKYRGRASTEVAIHRDGVVVRIDGFHRSLAFVDVTAVRLAPAKANMSCTLITESGESFRLPPDIASYSVASGALSATVIRGLAHRVGHQIETGASVEVIDSRGTSIFIIFRGIIVIAIGVLLVATLRHARRGVALVQHGILLTRQGWVGTKGGILVNADGVQPLRGDHCDLIRWDGLESVQADLESLIFRSKDGRSAVASPFAEHFWPVAAWVKSRGY